ncbi:hypothetical protein [Galactobacter sp.]|uniref:hypothetical protein n=1 Tax=Galactobacter sp. TaxID=2676125 RepID=UPI0025C55553|nr:hypothetical protein [Galactobacter sp.]
MGLFGRKPKQVPEPNAERQVRLRRGAGDLEVAGEKYHEKALKHVWKLAEDRDHIPAALDPEPSNPKDPNAVRVDLLVAGLAFHAGYLPAGDATPYAHALLPLYEQGLVGVGEAKLWKGNSGFQVYVKVSTDPLRLVPPAIEDPDGVFVDGLFDLTVVGEENHQDYLASVARTTRKDLLFSFFESTVPGGKDKGKATYAVTLHGQEIGLLTRRMAQKHHDVLQPLLDAGKRPYLLGRLEEDHRGWQAILEAPHSSTS